MPGAGLPAPSVHSHPSTRPSAISCDWIDLSRANHVARKPRLLARLGDLPLREAIAAARKGRGRLPQESWRSWSVLGLSRQDLP
jgi:hypothetical protein